MIPPLGVLSGVHLRSAKFWVLGLWSPCTRGLCVPSWPSVDFRRVFFDSLAFICGKKRKYQVSLKIGTAHPPSGRLSLCFQVSLRRFKRAAPLRIHNICRPTCFSMRIRQYRSQQGADPQRTEISRSPNPGRNAGSSFAAALGSAGYERSPDTRPADGPGPGYPAPGSPSPSPIGRGRGPRYRSSPPRRYGP